MVDDARKGLLTTFKNIALVENIEPRKLCKLVASGRAVIPLNVKNSDRERKLCAIGEGLRTKVNANIGTSPMVFDPEGELRKAKVAEEAGAHTVMDLSIGKELRSVRRKIIKGVSIPVGTVPVYEPFVNRQVADVDEDAFLKSLESHI